MSDGCRRVSPPGAREREEISRGSRPRRQIESIVERRKGAPRARGCHAETSINPFPIFFSIFVGHGVYAGLRMGIHGLSAAPFYARRSTRSVALGEIHEEICLALTELR